MRKIFISLVLLLLCGLPVKSATPTVFHVRNCSVNNGGNNTATDCRLPSISLSGNLLVATIQYGAATTVTVTDDKSQTWTCNSAIAGGQQVRLCYFPNTAAGVSKVHVAFGTSVGGTAVTLFEVNNIATSTPQDVSCGSNTASGTSAPCGSMTTTVDGDAIFEYCAQDSAPTNHETYTAGSGFSMLTNDKYDSQGSQFGIQATHGAINPTMTISLGASKTCVGAAFKNASAGTAPTGFYVVSMLDEALNPSNGYTTGATTLNIPCTGGNAVFLSWIGEPNVTIGTGGSAPVLSNPSTTPTSTGTTVASGSSGNLQAYQIGSGLSPTSTMSVAFTTSGSQVSGDTFISYCLAGSGGYDTRGTASGTQGAAGALTTASVTPTHSSGITFWVLGVASSTVPGVSPGIFNSAIPTPVSSPNTVDQNNGWGNNPYSGLSAQTFIATSGAAAYSDWASTADVFFAASGASPSGKAIIF